MELLDLWMAELLAFALVIARTGGIFSIAPVLGQARVPVQVRLILMIGVAIAVAPLASSAKTTVPTETLPFLFAMIKEIAVGLSIGFVCSLIIAAAQIAGDLIDHTIGFGLASTADPISGVQMPVLAQFMQLLATLVFLVSGAHHMMIRGLADSFGVVPLGGTLQFGAAALPVWQMFATLFVTGLKIAGPILGVLLLCDLALGLIGRTAPQMNLLNVGFPLKIGVAIMAVAVAMPAINQVLIGMSGTVHTQIMTLAKVLGG